MKVTRLRFSIFCLIVLSLVCLPFQKVAFDFDFDESITYFFYTPHIDFEIRDAKVISNGNSSIVSCNLDSSKDVKEHLPTIFGESVRIEHYSKETLLLIYKKYSQKALRTEKVDNYQFIYCYDQSLSNFVIVDSLKVNLQIAITESEINIGYPLILNGY